MIMSLYDFKTKNLKTTKKTETPSELSLHVIRQFARTYTDTKTEIPHTGLVLN